MRTSSVCGRALTRIVRYQLGADSDGRKCCFPLSGASKGSGAYFPFRGIYVQRNILSEEGVICAADKKPSGSRCPGGSKGGGAHFEKKGNCYLFRSKIALLRSRAPRAPTQAKKSLFYARRRHAFRLLHRTFRVTDNSRFTQQPQTERK